MNINSFVGLVQGQALHVLIADDGSTGACQLTRATAAADFAQQRIDLNPDDARVLLVRGVRRGDWIHSAVIVERASALLSIIAQAALGRAPRFPGG